MTPLSPPLRGLWSYVDYPDTLLLLGRTFRKAVWVWEGYDNVVAQYRQDCPKDSMHLMVYRDGHWQVDHLDSYNPDWAPKNLPLHLVFDIFPLLFRR